MRCLSFLEKYVVGPCDPGVVVRLYVASTHCRGFRGVVVGVVVSSTQKGLLVGVGVFVSGKTLFCKGVNPFCNGVNPFCNGDDPSPIRGYKWITPL